MDNVILETRSLNRYFGGLHAVNEVSFTTSRGQIKAIIGPNGAGKTTLFNLISGSMTPDSGSVLFMGVEITRLKPFAVAGLGLFRTFQTTKLFDHMTVLENVMVGRHTRSSAGFLSCMLHLPKTWKEERAIEKKAVEILEILQLESFKDEQAGNLPFGKQRLVEFARALSTEPKLLLLDEPAAGLNIHETGEMAELLLKIRDWGISLLIVEHDMSLIMDISDEILVLDQGLKIAEGKPEEIQKNPEVIKIYLGDDNA
jgi:branched-chain amino acid transport system ATP-binding protein